MARPWAPPPQLGRSKNLYGRLLAAKTHPKMGANLDLKKLIFEAQVGFHFGGGSWRPWAPQTIFLEAQEPPKTPSKMRSLETYFWMALETLVVRIHA